MRIEEFIIFLFLLLLIVFIAIYIKDKCDNKLNKLEIYYKDNIFNLAEERAHILFDIYKKEFEKNSKNIEQLYNDIFKKTEKFLEEKNSFEQEKEKYISIKKEIVQAYSKYKIYERQVQEFEEYKKQKEEEIQNEYAIMSTKKRHFQEELNTLLSEKTIGFPWVATHYKKYLLLLGDIKATYLETKKNPAFKAAESVREYSKKAAEAERKSLIFEGQLAYYESLFPWLQDFKEAPDETISMTKGTRKNDEKDPASTLLSSAEWEFLSSSEKFQKALDRYWKRKKTNWEIGREYERFIGYEYEIQGYDVTYFGAVKGLNDMGRDLLVKKGKQTNIIQCKYWSSEKIIHEKHIFQLFGTCIIYAIEHGGLLEQNSFIKLPKAVKGIFITSCTLSETALSVANALEIEVIQNKKFNYFPSVKCNISKNGEKIYHLPFDLQYDKIKIDPYKGEFYCFTVSEAEEKGFRRAFRWKGNK